MIKSTKKYLNNMGEFTRASILTSSCIRIEKE